jgi:hypothetical protein
LTPEGESVMAVRVRSYSRAGRFVRSHMRGLHRTRTKYSEPSLRDLMPVPSPMSYRNLHQRATYKPKTRGAARSSAAAEMARVTRERRIGGGGTPLSFL